MRGSLIDKRITAISAGAAHTLVLTTEGCVFSFGLGAAGRLGTGKTCDEHEPALVNSLCGMRVQAVSCGYAHSLLLMHDGMLLAFGHGAQGQLGLGTRQDQHLPRVVPTPVDSSKDSSSAPFFLAIAAGHSHSLALATDGVYEWGRQNGVDEREELCELLPARVMLKDATGNDVSVKSVAAGSRHSAVLSHDGFLYTWGEGKDGRYLRIA